MPNQSCHFSRACLEKVLEKENYQKILQEPPRKFKIGDRLFYVWPSTIYLPKIRMVNWQSSQSKIPFSCMETRLVVLFLKEKFIKNQFQIISKWNLINFCVCVWLVKKVFLIPLDQPSFMDDCLLNNLINICARGHYYVKKQIFHISIQVAFQCFATSFSK